MDNLRDLFPQDISDEAAYHIGNFLYELAFAFDNAYYAEISRYYQSEIDFAEEMRLQRDQGLNVEED